MVDLTTPYNLTSIIVGFILILGTVIGIARNYIRLEERVTKLEENHKATGKLITDLQTSVIGLTKDTVNRFDRFDDKLEAMDTKIDNKLDKLSDSLTTIKVWIGSEGKE